jgi:hypothetical protein
MSWGLAVLSLGCAAMLQNSFAALFYIDGDLQRIKM